MIHPTAVIHPSAQLHPSVSVGPYSVIDANVKLGAGCMVGPHVHITGHTTIGSSNRFHAGSVIGDEPQDLKYAGAPTRLLIGDRNVFREHVTIHRSNKSDEDTVIGSDCLFMADSHVGHNSVVGNHVIMANGSALGGHVIVGDRVFIAGNAMSHQFCRIGTLALMQGQAGISADLPPYCMSRQINVLAGLNIIGLRRAGIPAADRLELKRLYHLLFRSGKRLRDAVAEARETARGTAGMHLVEFMSQPTKRGYCASAKGPNAAHATDKE
jgi:UDP-N-acetylglucosamine acyltransferase